jgi:mortality factor 4-like protein 1
MSSKASLTSNEHDDDDDDEQDDDHSEASSQEEDLPLSKYQVKQKVLARDADGLLYEAWIRRCLYGPHHHKQVQIGMVNNQAEMEDYWQRHSQPTWHYFVHYTKWKVNWDRWVSQEDILELTPENSELAISISQEHRALQKEFKAKSNKGKVRDGGAFLRAWKKRLQAMQEERTGNTTDQKKTAAAKRKQAAGGAWTKAALEKERKLRQRDLTLTTTNKNDTQKQKIVLPFSLKRVLVEEWEVISQCHMVHSLPAPVTIRQALEQYLAESKGIQIQQHKSTSVVEIDAPKEEAGDTKPMDVEESKSKSENKEPSKELAEGQEDEETKARNKEWTDMVDGIILLFDQALPFRLLYPQELIQHAAVEADDELCERSKADLYGCEHLLRLCLRLADIVAQDMDEEESKPLLAKVNDLVRFLHKHQSTLFAQSYRKLNEAELQQHSKREKIKERKRKKLAEQQGALKKSKPNEEEEEVE